MGIQSSAATYTRFFVDEPATEDFWTFVDEKLKAGRFKDLEEGQEKSAGFASWDDFFDSSFSDASYHKGEYIAFQFRLDEKKVPPIIIKQYVREAIQKYRDENEGHWPSRQERQEIRENVDTWLNSRAFAKPTGFEVVWNPAAKWMYLGTTSTKMVEAFLEHFEGHFHLYPVPLYHIHWASNLIPLDGHQRDVLSSLVSEKSANVIDEGRFIGYEFLTWLWYLCEDSQGVVEISEDRRVDLLLGERIVVEMPGEGKERVVCTTQANALHEARTGLRQGKLVEQMQLFLGSEDNEYTFTLDSSLWAVKGLKTPKQLQESDEEDSDGRFLEKMYFLEDVARILNSLYARFLAERLGSGWESDTLPRLKEWIEKGGEESVEAKAHEAVADAPPF